MIKTLKELNDALDIAQKSKETYKTLIQDSLEFFINEYNKKLTYNTQPFKRIVSVCGKDIKDLRLFLFNYTNITAVKSDLSFETSDYIIKKDKNGKPQKYFSLAFNESFKGQKWYETSDKTDKEAIIKELTNDDLIKALKSLFKRFNKSESKYETKETNILKAIQTAYGL